MKLYELAAQYQKALDRIDAENDDLPEGEWDLVLALEDAFEAKVEGVAKFIKSLSADADAIDAEKKRLSARSRSIDGKIEWLKGYLKYALESTGRDKMKGELLTVSLRQAPWSCLIADEKAVPEAFVHVETVRSIDKRAIIDHFKASGEVIPGVEVVTDKRTVQIR